MLLFAYIDFYILGTGAFAHNHSHINGLGRHYEHASAVLRLKNAVCAGLACFKGNKGAVAAGGDIALIRGIAIKYGVHNAFAAGIRKKGGTVAEKPAGGNGEFQTHGDAA